MTARSLYRAMKHPDPQEALDAPECDRCGAIMDVRFDFAEEPGYQVSTSCTACEKRREMHHDRGRQLRQRTRRLGRDRKPEADRMWYALGARTGRTYGPAIPYDHPEAVARRAERDDDLPF